MFALNNGDFEAAALPARDIERRLLALRPGAELAVALEGIERDRLDGDERVALMQARARLLSHVQAELYADMVSVGQAVAEAIGEHDVECEADEVRAALVLTRRAALDQMSVALALEQHPALMQGMTEGRLDAPRARVILDGLVGLERTTAGAVVEKIITEAPTMTTGQLRAKVARLAISADPAAAANRYQETVKGRRVWAQANSDGTAGLFGLDLPADRVAAAMRKIHELASAIKTADDDRTADQIRADIFLDLLAGEAQESPTGRATIDLRVPLTTLAGLDENPGEIPGWGPVIADIARKIANAQRKASWRVTVTGDGGEVVWIGTTNRRPSASMRRHLEVTAKVCVFPGCRMPAGDSDLDHHQPWAEGGATDPTNLGPLCRHDHRLKHKGGWNLQRVGFGKWRWCSPLGRMYEVGRDPP